ncbi:MAG: LysR family transcriptional regulator [Ruminococcaceae bacterium]|nr:LysR family transcriptional regulator [Oscillospiraceae bacterium]
MEIRNLITFVHVAELGSFTRAAKALDYSQSTVSFQIKQLENELDCLLFERINHNITLTAKGRQLLSYAHKINRLTEEFAEENQSERQLRGYFHVVTPDSVCEDMILTNYATFHQTYPEISLKFTNTGTEEMFHMLDRNEADLIMTLDSHIYRSDYVIAKEEPVSMHFVVGSRSPLAGADSLSVTDIVNEEFILTEKNFGYRRVFDEELAKRSLEIIPKLEIGRTDVIASLLTNGSALSYLPDFVTKEMVTEGRLVYLPVHDFKLDIWKQLIYHRSKWISQGLRALIEFIMENEFGR